MCNTTAIFRYGDALMNLLQGFNAFQMLLTIPNAHAISRYFDVRFVQNCINPYPNFINSHTKIEINRTHKPSYQTNNLKIQFDEWWIQQLQQRHHLASVIDRKIVLKSHTSHFDERMLSFTLALYLKLFLYFVNR